MSRHTPPRSGTVIVGKKPIWEMLAEQEVALHNRWHELRAKGWFTIEDVRKKTNWTDRIARGWISRMGFKSELLPDPVSLRRVNLYEPAPDKKFAPAK